MVSGPRWPDCGISAPVTARAAHLSQFQGLGLVLRPPWSRAPEGPLLLLGRLRGSPRASSLLSQGGAGRGEPSL